MKHLLTLMLLLATLGLTGCEREGPAERAGEAMDEAAEDFGDAVEDATDN